MPSSAMVWHSSLAEAAVSSVTEPSPIAKEMRLLMGPKQMRFTVTAMASTMARAASPRTRNFLERDILLAPIMAAMARISTTPSPMR